MEETAFSPQTTAKRPEGMAAPVTGETPVAEVGQERKVLPKGKTLFFAFLALLVAGVLVYRLFPLLRKEGFKLPFKLPFEKLEVSPASTLTPVPGSKEGEPGSTVSPEMPVGGTTAQENLCDKGFIFSQKDCQCVADIHACAGLNKENCQKREGCYSFSRSGSCTCPQCEIFLEHQCLPKE